MRWEFWPMCLFYAPVAAWVAALALRHGGLATVTAANPGMRDGGTVGESKYEILSALPQDAIVPSAFVPPGPPAARLECLWAVVRQRGWHLPLVLKPDVGQRGTGVRLVRTVPDATRYLAGEAGAVLVQPYHPGPHEAGIFYCRHPAWTHGRILSITDKHVPVIVGDGQSTVEALVWSHPRYRFQADLFLERHRDARRRVLAAGERLPLGLAGNHAQGALFRDGMYLWTRDLEGRIDAIARAYPGLFVGRFDVRYTDVDAFRAGHDIAIVELNGATAESTDIYDPARSLLQAYRRLFQQWSLVFAIGAANRAAGAQITPLVRLVRLTVLHLTSRPAFHISD
jgi:hypothetical protein